MPITNKRVLKQIPAGVWILGFVSMLMDISSEMVHSLLPMFMVGTLGASVFMVGLIEGLAESTALIVKIFSGALSDYLVVSTMLMTGAIAKSGLDNAPKA